MKHLTLALAALALVAGCATPPDTRYYTLDMTPTVGIDALPISVVIDGLRPAQPLRRGEILIMRSPTEIEYYAEHEWAADVEEMVAQKLEEELPPRQPGAPVIYVTGDILAFEQVDTAEGFKPHVKLALDYRVADMGRYDDPLLEATYENDYTQEKPVAPPTAAVDDTAPAVVAALSERLAAMASAIAEDAQKAAEIARERGLIE